MNLAERIDEELKLGMPDSTRGVLQDCFVALTAEPVAWKIIKPVAEYDNHYECTGCGEVVFVRAEDSVPSPHVHALSTRQRDTEEK